MQANVIINATYNGKKVATTIAYINLQAPNERLLELAQSINALTNNIFTSATKEIKGEVL